MSDLTSTEKLKLEKIFEMSSGYVLNFSNATFQDFILENFNIDIYCEKYDFRSGSKANRLRAFWKKENNYTVGKLLEALLQYACTSKSLHNGFISVEEKNLFDDCQKIIQRLKYSNRDSNSIKEYKDNKRLSLDKSKLLSKFDDFANYKNTQYKQKRGYLLEELLINIFNLYQIETQKSFRRNQGGEQIDGAFKFDGWYYLVECKWTERLTDIRQLDSLYGKVNRSGKQTLGLFLSINGWSENVCSLLKQNHDKSIILMDGFDLRCVLNEYNNLNLKYLLSKKLDYLNFVGEPFYSAVQLLNNQKS